MELMVQVKAWLYKEFLMEWRQKYALNGIILYTVSTIFICYLAFSIRGASMSPIVWNTMLWIIVLFSAINAIAKSFLQENSQRSVYYYSITSPVAIIIAKIIYGMILMSVLVSLALIVYSVLLGNPVDDLPLYIFVLFAASLALSSMLTMISAIAAKAGNNSMIMAILSFPIVLPVILMAIKASKNAMDGIARSESIDEILVLIALNVIIITLALLLFPYLWRN
ncbi:MAG: heme exporter protein CcmB [Bacteroidetes bacterium]|nr:heme exporter protein CcmB [Bacteroidota bacterium]MDA1121316.1 heme exporter protein CcmB [Bacteroidota bacterium]